MLIHIQTHTGDLSARDFVSYYFISNNQCQRILGQKGMTKCLETSGFKIRFMSDTLELIDPESKELCQKGPWHPEGSNSTPCSCHVDVQGKRQCVQGLRAHILGRHLFL